MYKLFLQSGPFSTAELVFSMKSTAKFAGSVLGADVRMGVTWAGRYPRSIAAAADLAFPLVVYHGETSNTFIAWLIEAEIGKQVAAAKLIDEEIYWDGPMGLCEMHELQVFFDWATSHLLKQLGTFGTVEKSDVYTAVTRHDLIFTPVLIKPDIALIRAMVTIDKTASEWTVAIGAKGASQPAI